MYDTILVTLDATPTDRVIVDHIKALATRLHSSVVLLHVISSVTALIQGPASVSAEITRETGYLEKIREELQAVGVSTEGELVYGEPVKEIVKWVQERGCDLEPIRE